MPGGDPRLALSIVFPVHDEADNVAPLLAEIAALWPARRPWRSRRSRGSCRRSAARRAAVSSVLPSSTKTISASSIVPASARISASSGATFSASSWTGTTIDRGKRGSAPAIVGRRRLSRARRSG